MRLLPGLAIWGGRPNCRDLFPLPSLMVRMKTGGPIRLFGAGFAVLLFGVKDSFEKEDSGRGVDDVEAGELGDPSADLDWIELGGEDAGGGLNHHEDSGNRERKKYKG